MKYGLNNRTLIVSTLENAMFTMKKNKRYMGYCIDLLDSLSSALNFSYEIIEPEDGEWGAEINGTWNGLVGQLERREVDFVIASLSIHEDREKVMDFLYPPIFTKADDIAYKRPIDANTRWRLFLNSFSNTVLLILTAMLLLYTILLNFLLKLTNDKLKKSPLLLYIWPYGISDQFLYTFGMLLNRGVGIHTKRESIRLLVFSWGLFGIIVAAFYSANLVAQFAVHKTQIPFRDLRELVQQKDFKWGFQSGHIREHIFRLSKGDDMRLAWEGAVEANKTDPDVLSRDIQKHIAKLKQGKYAFFESRHTLYGLMKNDCTINIVGQDVIWHQYGLGVSTDYPLRKDIESTLSVIADSGLFDLWWKRWGVKKPESCFQEDEVHVIHLVDVASAFYLLCSGFGFALFVLLVEMLVKLSKEVSNRS